MLTEPLIYSLPFDIISDIFLLCVRQNWTDHLRFAQVSTLWRKYVFADARLWTTIVMKGSRDRNSLPISQLSSWLENVKESRIDMVVDCVLNGLELDSLLDVLMEKGDQFRNLYWAPPVAGLIDLKFQHLVRLTLYRSSDSTRHDPIPAIYEDDLNADGGRIHPMPSLRILDVIALVRIPFEIGPTFPPLQHLKILDIEPGDWLPIVVQCAPSLISLHIGFCLRVEEPKEQILFPQLQYLALSKVNMFNEYIATPALKLFTESFRFEDGKLPSMTENLKGWACVRNGLFRPHSSAHILDDPILREMDAYPNLEYFHLEEDVATTCTVLEYLKLHPKIWPKLRKVVLSGWRATDVPVPLRELVASRKEEYGIKIEINLRPLAWRPMRSSPTPVALNEWDPFQLLDSSFSPTKYGLAAVPEPLDGSATSLRP